MTPVDKDGIFRVELPRVEDVADDPRWRPYLDQLAAAELVRERLDGRGGGKEADDAPLTLAQAANVVGLSRKTLYRIAPDPATPFYKLRSRWMVERPALLEWVERSKAAAEPTPRPARPSKPRRGARKVLEA